MTFISQYSLKEKPVFDQLVISVYFMLTTLSTVGYGDFTPQSLMEKIVGSVIMFCGVTFFSYMMGQFLNIIMDLTSNDEVS